MVVKGLRDCLAFRSVASVPLKYLDPYQFLPRGKAVFWDTEGEMSFLCFLCMDSVPQSVPIIPTTYNCFTYMPNIPYEASS